jgi:hypothetical protein
MKRICEEVLEATGVTNDPLLEIALDLEKIAVQVGGFLHTCLFGWFRLPLCDWARLVFAGGMFGGLFAGPRPGDDCRAGGGLSECY